MHRCPAAAILSRSDDMRRHFRSEFRSMCKLTLFERYSQDQRSLTVQEDDYVIRRIKEFRRWNPGQDFVLIGPA